MKKVIAGVAGVLGVVVVGFVGVVAMQPATTHIERSIVIAGTPADAMPHVTDMKRFVVWNPWSAMDPNQTVTFSEPADGVGAWYAWSGEITGKGKMTNLTIEEGAKVTQKLEFQEPFVAEAAVAFLIAPAAEGVSVTWTYDGQNNFMAKAAGLFMDMEGMLGGDFEKGLASLKTKVEADAAARIAAELQAAADAKAAEEAAAAATAAAEGGTEGTDAAAPTP